VWREQGTGGAYAEMDPAVLDEPRRGTPPRSEVSDYPMGGSAPAVLEWVGSDPARARIALARELERPSPRATIVTPLQRLAGIWT